MEKNEVLELLKSSKMKNNMVMILPRSDIGNTIIKALENETASIILLEAAVEEIENLYGRDTELTIKIRDFLKA